MRLHRAGRLDEAARGYEQILAAVPQHATTLHLLGMIAAQRGDHATAEDLIGRSISISPDVPEAHFNLGVALQTQGRTADAVRSFRRSLELRPGVADTHAQLSIALQELGEGDEARAEVERALEIDPGSVRAWFVLSDLKTFAAGDPDLARMEALAARPGLSADDQALINFALAKAWMDSGDGERAFARLATANQLKRRSFAYDVDADVAWLEAIAAGLPAETMARLSGGGDPSGLPVFVVGMPRSGTTLVEQILASHPAFHGAGELTILEELICGDDRSPGAQAASYLRRAANISAQDLAELGGAYVARISPLAAGKRHVIDKSPGNFRFAGLISLMAPNARIIHCRRDPADTCLSCYQRNFSGLVRYAFDMEELGAYYRAYDGLMAHWRRVLPRDRFIEVDYEALVGDLEGQARRLIGFCGEPWDAACLDFHKTPRLVRTISANQVRRPLYSSSVGRWKRYERHLGPLLAALGGAAPPDPARLQGSNAASSPAAAVRARLRRQ